MTILPLLASPPVSRREPGQPRPVILDLQPAVATSSASLELTVQRVLLASARRLLDNGENEAAIVAAQTASEVFLARTMDELFRLRGLANLREDINRLIRSYALQPGRRNKELRKLYTSLSEDTDLVHQPFWKELGPHMDRRRKVVHEQASATKGEAEASYQAIDALMNHVEGVLAGVRTRFGSA